MTSSTVSQSQHPVQLSRRRERSQPTLWAVASLFFILGAAASALTIWQLHKLYRATIAPPVSVEGEVKAQYDYNIGNDMTPPPTGYYVESAGVGRVYLQGPPLQPYVGKSVIATGSVSGLCGPKSIPCYPLLDVRDVSYPEAE